MDIKEKFMYALGAFVILSALITVILPMFVEVPEKNNSLIMLAVGQWLTFVGIVVGYFYGSSKSSADKTALLAKNGGSEKPPES